MSVFGIVCETNPIHNGHKYLIRSAREQGAEAIVCVMSGNTVQRGEFAIADKYLRAEALIRCGADLVLELPYPWASASAEYFSRAAISILRHFCDTVIFGSECGDIDLLKCAADAACSYEFKDEFNAKISNGVPAAKLYFDMLEVCAGIKLSSNDLLGVEYIKTARHLSSHIDFRTVVRKGDSYTSLEISDQSFPSAMSIRRQWQEKNTENIEKYIPEEALKIYKNAIEEEKITDYGMLDTILLSFFRLHGGSDFENIAGAGGGVANRICEMAHKARSADELMELVKNKRYTDASLRRTMLYCMSGVTKDILEDLPKEALLLAANENGRVLISKNRKRDGVKIVTKPADLDMSLQQNILMKRIDSIYTLLFNEHSESYEFMKRKPYIAK
ncbi:MAG: nucleotidyltransferase family protein [Clostridia bacterium]|nr:nucleotidyltransferase family protein [Clostridia bacterium]